MCLLWIGTLVDRHTEQQTPSDSVRPMAPGHGEAGAMCPRSLRLKDRYILRQPSTGLVRCESQALGTKLTSCVEVDCSIQISGFNSAIPLHLAAYELVLSGRTLTAREIYYCHLDLFEQPAPCFPDATRLGRACTLSPAEWHHLLHCHHCDCIHTVHLLRAAQQNPAAL